MSTGHMSRVEQVWTLVGGPAAIGVPFFATAGMSGVVGVALAVALLLVCLAGFFLVKAWIWHHTIYPDGYSSATFVWNPEDYPEDMR